MIKEESPDGVKILVPNSYHFEISKYCIKRGFIIFVE